MKHPKLDLFLVIMATGLLFNGLLIQQGIITYPIPVHTISQDIGTLDISDEENSIHANLVLKSNSFSANYPITASITIDSTKTNSTTMYVYFPDSVGLPIKKSGFAHVVDGAQLKALLEKDDYYHGKVELLYPKEGCYPILISSKDVKQIKQSALDPQFPCKLIQISSLDSTNSLYTNQTLIGLTYVIIAVSFLAIRPILHSFYDDFDNEKL
ncbi:MAG: hypothetical protein ACW9W4_00710 [Candidatus Nitrosopumilus sp. bin_7KS]